MTIGHPGASQQMWVVRAGRGGRLATEFESGAFVAIGFNVSTDVTGLSRDQIVAATSQSNPEQSAGTVGSWASQLYRFINDIRLGDLVVTPDGETRELLFGEVTGPAEFAPIPPASNFHHVRSVRWLARRPRDVLPRRVLYSIGSLSTAFRPGGQEQLRALLAEHAIPDDQPGSAEGAAEESPPEDLIADLHSRSGELVWSKVAGLGAYETQDLVAGILRAMGYHTEVAGPGTDQGVDIVASRDPLGLEQIVRVQVKARPNTRTGAPELVQLAGNLGPGERGIFVSTGGFYREAESHHAARNVRRIDGQELQALFVEYYERLDEDTKALVPLRRLYFPSD